VVDRWTRARGSGGAGFLGAPCCTTAFLGFSPALCVLGCCSAALAWCLACRAIRCARRSRLLRGLRFFGLLSRDWSDGAVVSDQMRAGGFAAAIFLSPFSPFSWSLEGFVRVLSSLFSCIFFHCFAYALVLTRPTPCYRITRKRFAIELSWFGSASICFGLGHFLFVLCGVPSLAFSSVPFLVLWSSLQTGRSAATSWAFPPSAICFPSGI